MCNPRELFSPPLCVLVSMDTSGSDKMLHCLLLYFMLFAETIVNITAVNLREKSSEGSDMKLLIWGFWVELNPSQESGNSYQV